MFDCLGIRTQIVNAGMYRNGDSSAGHWRRGKAETHTLKSTCGSASTCTGGKNKDKCFKHNHMPGEDAGCARVPVWRVCAFTLPHPIVRWTLETLNRLWSYYASDD